ncbi:MAG: LysM peptidoglycan-binding domain-containing protein [Gemmatimonadales bacterium]
MTPSGNQPFPDFSDVRGGGSSSAPEPQAEQAPVVRTHTVVKGDSLSKIAKQYYGKVTLWKMLYEANKAVVGANPDLIKPGQVLVIPELGENA